MPVTLTLTTTESGRTVPVLSMLNSHAAWFAPDELKIDIGGHTRVLPLKVTPAIVELSWSVIGPEVTM
jgi:hypothetical protein